MDGPQPLLFFAFSILVSFLALDAVGAPVPQNETPPPVTHGTPRRLDHDAICSRPAPSSQVLEPTDLHSQNGQLIVDLALRNETDEHGRARYCYLYDGVVESPTLRLNPGDLLVLRLKNELTSLAPSSGSSSQPSKSNSAPKENAIAKTPQTGTSNPCGNVAMDATATNLHFHGLMVPPACHQDDVLHTSIEPSDSAFEYRMRIPDDQPPGLYWYHPHLHGFTRAQVVGGASGALIIEGIEQKNKQVAGLPERVIVIRDEDLLNPAAAPEGARQKAPSVMLDRDGDARNTADGSGTPTKDLSLNFVSVPYPAYKPAIIRMRPLERQFWRVVNASSITYLNLQWLVDEKPQSLGVAAVDGAPVNENGQGGDYVLWQSHLGVPPGGRIEFIVTAPGLGTTATLITRSVNTGPDGENDPTRPLANIVTSADAPEPPLTLPVALPSSSPRASAPKITALPWLGKVTPNRTRKLYFSEQPHNPSDPNGPTDFFLTVEGQKPILFDPMSSIPNIVVQQGDVEDWIIENRSKELHAFHIHQIHFLLMEWTGMPDQRAFSARHVNVPY